MELIPGTFNGFLIALLFSPFIFIATGLSIIRFGLGLSGAGMGVVVLLLSLALSLSVSVSPKLESVGGFEAVARGNPEAQSVATVLLQDKFPGVEKNLRVLLKENALKQFKDACTLGLTWLLPFVLVDLLLLHAGGLLGVSGVSATSIGLAIKLLLFLSVDGITQVANKLLIG